MSIIINDDFMVYVQQKFKDGYQPESREQAIRDILAYTERYRGTGVKEIFYNPNAQLSYSPSEVWEYAEHRYQRTEVDGIPVNFKGNYLDVWHKLCVEYNIDLYTYFIEGTRQAGISPWLTFRFDDVHDSMTETGELRGSDYTHTARSRGIVRCRHHALCGYHDNALDYAIPEVRERFMAYVKEQLERYDVDGVELDFMREPYAFKPGYEDEGMAIIRGICEEIRELCCELAARRGHPVGLAVRTFRDPESDFYSGINAVGLAKAGLVDIVITTPRWASCDSAIPIGLWRQILPDGVRLAYGTDILYRTSAKNANHFYTDEQLFGLANQAYTEGADSIYLFNFTYRDELDSPKAIAPLLIAGSSESLSGAHRRHTVSYQDVCAVGENRIWKPLPVELGPDQYFTMRIPTGTPGETMFLLIGAGVEEKELEIYMNSAPVDYLGHGNVEEALWDEPVKVYRLNALRPSYQMLEIRSTVPATLFFTELRTACPQLRK